jgi:hypothetical protein
LRQLRASPNGLTRTEIRDLFGRHQSAAQTGRALASLAELGLIQSVLEKTEGRPAERWVATAPCDISDQSDQSRLTAAAAVPLAPSAPIPGTGDTDPAEEEYEL